MNRFQLILAAVSGKVLTLDQAQAIDPRFLEHKDQAAESVVTDEVIAASQIAQANVLLKKAAGRKAKAARKQDAVDTVNKITGAKSQ